MSSHTLVNRDAAVAALGQAIGDVFLRHAHAADEGALRTMHQAVDRYLLELRWAKAEHPFIDLDLAEDIAAACKALLTQLDPQDARMAALVGGAVRYFLDAEDAAGDFESAEGLMDDAQVVNYVIRETGLRVSALDVDPPVKNSELTE